MLRTSVVVQFCHSLSTFAIQPTNYSPDRYFIAEPMSISGSNKVRHESTGELKLGSKKRKRGRIFYRLTINVIAQYDIRVLTPLIFVGNT